MNVKKSIFLPLLPPGRFKHRSRTQIGSLALLCMTFFPGQAAHAATGSEVATVTSPQAGHAPWAASVRKALSNRAHRLALASHNILAWSQHGMASWYGRGLSGHRTSSGQKLDGRALTAAHPTLPFGSKVLVKNEDTGRSVIVTVNDRGPFNNRIIDLSRAAAAELGMLGSGTAHVKLAPIPSDAPITNDQPLEVAEAEADDTSEQAIDAVTPVRPHHQHTKTIHRRPHRK